MTNKEALEELRTNPQSFLERYRVTTNFQVTGKAGVVEAYLQHNMGLGFDGEEDFAIVNPGNDLSDAERFTAYAIPTQRWNDHIDLQAQRLPPAGSADIMITASITGCSIVWQPLRKTDGIGNGPFVAHIQPQAGSSGLSLQGNLEHTTNRRFPWQSRKAHVFGRRNYGDNSLNIIAVRKDAWYLFFQQWRKDASRSPATERLGPVTYRKLS